MTPRDRAIEILELFAAYRPERDGDRLAAFGGEDSLFYPNAGVGVIQSANGAYSKDLGGPLDVEATAYLNAKTDKERREVAARAVVRHLEHVRRLGDVETTPPLAKRPTRTPGDQNVPTSTIARVHDLARRGLSHREIERRTGIGRKRIPKVLARAA